MRLFPGSTLIGRIRGSHSPSKHLRAVCATTDMAGIGAIL
jgi:hypothetical protein